MSNGTLSVLSYGSVGSRLGVVTRNCRRAVAALGQPAQWCDVLLTREDVPRVKPAPAHLLAALRALNLQPQHALMIGDHSYGSVGPADIVAARAAGVQGLGVLTGTGKREQFVDAGAVFVLNSVAELPAWLDGWRDGSRG